MKVQVIQMYDIFAKWEENGYHAQDQLRNHQACHELEIARMLASLSCWW